MSLTIKQKKEIDDLYKQKKALYDSVPNSKNAGEFIKTLKEPTSESKAIYSKIKDIDKQIEEKQKSLRDSQGVIENKTPSAPFVTETSAWVKLALKTALKEAVKEGADKISWTTGEQQNSRYDLSKQVKDIVTTKVDADGNKNVLMTLHTDGNGVALTVNKEGNVISSKTNQNFVGSKLEDIVGKDMAEKIMSNDGVELYEGNDLKVGGKGMIGFYGSPKEGKLGIVGQVAEKLFGKVKTNEIETKLGENSEARFQIQKNENHPQQWSVTDENANLVSRHKTYEEAKKAQQDLINSKKNQSQSKQHSIDITPELKSKIEKEGQPLFQKNGEGKPKGALETLQDGRVIIHALDAPDFSTMVHEIGHIFEKDLTEQEAKTVKDFGGSEAFARGFEKYLRDGKSPTPELKTLFEKFKTWLTDIYKTLKGSPIAKKLSPEIKQIFDRLLTEQKSDVPLEGEKNVGGENVFEKVEKGKVKVEDLSPMERFVEDNYEGIARELKAKKLLEAPCL